MCTLMAMASPMSGNVMATESAPPQATQRGGHSAMINAGSKILRDIAVSQTVDQVECVLHVCVRVIDMIWVLCGDFINAVLILSLTLIQIV